MPRNPTPGIQPGLGGTGESGTNLELISGRPMHLGPSISASAELLPLHDVPSPTTSAK